MTNGCDVCDIHGGGCGAHEGVIAGCVLVCLVTPGNGCRPAGFPIPLLNGVNEAPNGLTSG
jgi:hypothetical protein